MGLSGVSHESTFWFYLPHLASTREYVGTLHSVICIVEISKLNAFSNYAHSLGRFPQLFFHH